MRGASRLVLPSALLVSLLGCPLRGPDPPDTPALSSGPACGVARHPLISSSLPGTSGPATATAAGDILVTVRGFAPDLRGRILRRLAPWGPAGWNTLSPQLGLIHLDHRPALDVIRARLSGLSGVTVQFNQPYHLEAPGSQGPQ